jgi:hypothetical protein
LSSKDVFFPPGDTLCAYEAEETPSTLGDEENPGILEGEGDRCPHIGEEDPTQTNLWRETSFAFCLLRCAVNPVLSLSKCLERWYLIAKDLAEGNRKRPRQMVEVYQYRRGVAVPGG